MTINFILNGEDVSLQAEAENRLIEILRGNFGLTGTKGSCYASNCGACSVIFNGNVVKSCLIPAFKISGSEVITIEGFMMTDEYQDFVYGFNRTKIENCGFCTVGKILATESLLNRNLQPSAEEILNAFDGVKCRCTDPEELAKTVMVIAEHRRRRRYGRS